VSSTSCNEARIVVERSFATSKSMSLGNDARNTGSTA